MPVHTWVCHFKAPAFAIFKSCKREIAAAATTKKTNNKEQRTNNKEQRTNNKQQTTNNKEQRTTNKQQRTKN